MTSQPILYPRGGRHSELPDVRMIRHARDRQVHEAANRAWRRKARRVLGWTSLYALAMSGFAAAVTWLALASDWLFVGVGR